jgi:hypothetical protein
MSDIIPLRSGPADLFVYFIRADEHGPIKIGHSTNVEKRLEQLQTGSSHPLRLLAKFKHDRAKEIEKSLHSAFADLRLEGEWFEASDRILDVIAAWRTAEGDPRPDLDAIHIAPVRQALGRLDWWVVEWSEAHQQVHIGPLIASLSMTREALLMGRHENSDFVIVSICEDAESAENAAAVIEERLKAVSLARRLGCTESSWRIAAERGAL